MMLAVEVIAWLTALAWLWKLAGAARGLPRIPNLFNPQHDRTPAGSPTIVAIVPARNEAEEIAAALESLLHQDYSNLHIIAVDDRSTDTTGAIMDALATAHPDRLTALHVTELPPDWLGKTHAMALAARHANAIARPDYFLFTDGDVRFHPEAVRRSLAQAVATSADHFVIFPTPIIQSTGEGMMLGYLQIMGLWATRPWLAANPRNIRDSVGIGAFCLVRSEAYRQLGGFEALRMEILEDLNFARRIKQAGLRQRVAIAPGMIMLHWASGALGIVNVMTKNLFAVFGFSTTLTLLTVLWLVLFCLSPLAWLFLPATLIPALLTLASVIGLYLVSRRHSRISPWYAVAFPAGAALFIYSLLRSTMTTLINRGVIWRGTFYALDTLKTYRRQK